MIYYSGKKKFHFGFYSVRRRSAAASLPRGPLLSSTHLKSGVVAKDSVCVGEELAHDGGDDDDWFFAVCDKPFVKRLKPWVMFAGRQGRHEEGSLDLRSAAANEAVTVGRAALIGMVAKPASEAMRLGLAEPSSGSKPTRAAAVETNPGDGDKGFHRPGDRLASLDQGFDFGVERFDSGLELAQKAVVMRAQRPGVGSVTPIAVGEPVGDEIASGQHEGLQIDAFLVASAPERQVATALLSVACEARASMASVLPSVRTIG